MNEDIYHTERSRLSICIVTLKFADYIQGTLGDSALYVPTAFSASRVFGFLNIESEDAH